MGGLYPGFLRNELLGLVLWELGCLNKQDAVFIISFFFFFPSKISILGEHQIRILETAWSATCLGLTTFWEEWENSVVHAWRSCASFISTGLIIVSRLMTYWSQDPCHMPFTVLQIVTCLPASLTPPHVLRYCSGEHSTRTKSEIKKKKELVQLSLIYETQTTPETTFYLKEKRFILSCHHGK